MDDLVRLEVEDDEADDPGAVAGPAGHRDVLAPVLHEEAVRADVTQPDRADALKADLLEVARRFDVSEDDTLVLRLDYLEAVVRKPSWL